MVILDTCTLLWLVADQDKLSQEARRTIGEANQGLYVSAISAFEVAVKHRNGRLTLPKPPQQWFPEAIEFHGIRELPVSSTIALRSVQLQPLHNDPCDRIVIATAQVNSLAIVTCDALIAQYSGTAVVW